jgi:hypothetical protein
MKMNENQKALFDAVSGIDAALVQEATAPRPAQVKRTLWRVAAAAAVVAILIGAFIGLLGNDSNVTPFFSIQVYANETDSVELSADGEKTAVSNVAPSNTYPELGLLSAPLPDTPEPMFWITIWLGEGCSMYKEHRLTVLCNGKEIEGKSSDSIKIAFAASIENDDVGYCIFGRVRKIANLKISLTTPDGTLLQESIVRIYPLLSGGYYVHLVDTSINGNYKIELDS